MDMRWLVLIIGFLAVFSTANAYIIINDTVMYIGSYGNISVTPHTCKGFFCTQYANLTSNVTGTVNMDFAFQFQNSIQNGRVWYWTNMSHPYVYCSHYNTTFVWDEINQTTYNYTSCDIYGVNQNYYYDWKDITNMFIHDIYNGSHWYWIGNISMTKGVTKQVKWQYNIPISMSEDNTFGSEGKWDMWIKRSSDTISQALSNGYYVHLDPWWNSSWVNCRNITIVNGTNADYTNFYFKTNMTGLIFNNINEVRIINNYCGNGGTEIPRDIISNTTTSVYTGFEANYTIGGINKYSVYYNSTGAGSPIGTTDALLNVTSSGINNSKLRMDLTAGAYGDGYHVYYSPFSNTSPVGYGYGTGAGNYKILGNQISNWAEDRASTITSDNNYTQMKAFTYKSWDDDKVNTTSVCEVYANSNCMKCNDTFVYGTTNGATNAFMRMIGYQGSTSITGVASAWRNATGILKEITTNAGDAQNNWDGKIYQVYNTTTNTWSQSLMIMNANYTTNNTWLYTGYAGIGGNQQIGLYPANYTANKTYTHTYVYCVHSTNWTAFDMDTEYLRWSNPLTATLGASEGDTTLYPPYFSEGTSNTTMKGKPILFSAQVYDDSAVSGYKFSTNNSGSWVNDSFITASNGSWMNTTKILSSTKGGVIGYRWYANDSANDWNQTSIYTVTVTNLVPYFSTGSTNNSIFLQDTLFTIKGYDGDGNDLSYYKFSTNLTGSWVNNTPVAVTNNNSDLNAVKNLNVIGTIGYRWYLNDTSNDWNTSDIYTVVSHDIVRLSLNGSNVTTTYSGFPVSLYAFWNSSNGLANYTFNQINYTRINASAGNYTQSNFTNSGLSSAYLSTTTYSWKLCSGGYFCSYDNYWNSYDVLPSSCLISPIQINTSTVYHPGTPDWISASYSVDSTCYNGTDYLPVSSTYAGIDGYIASISEQYINGGTSTNSTYAMTGTTNWSNMTVIMPYGTNDYYYQIYATDLLGYQNTTGIQHISIDTYGIVNSYPSSFNVSTNGTFSQDWTMNLYPYTLSDSITWGFSSAITDYFTVDSTLSGTIMLSNNTNQTTTFTFTPNINAVNGIYSGTLTYTRNSNGTSYILPFAITLTAPINPKINILSPSAVAYSDVRPVILSFNITDDYRPSNNYNYTVYVDSVDNYTLTSYNITSGSTTKNNQTNVSLGVLPEGDYKLSMKATNTNFSIATRSGTVEFTIGDSPNIAGATTDYGFNLGTNWEQNIVFWTFIVIFILVGILIMLGSMY
jgi:hypothetical protein